MAPRPPARIRLAAVWSVLALPFLYGAAIDDGVDVGGGGGQYYFGVCGTTSRVRYGQGFVRVRQRTHEHFAIEMTGGAAVAHDRVVESEPDDNGDVSPPVGSSDTDGFVFLRPRVDFDFAWLGAAVGALGIAHGGAADVLPAYHLRLGPRFLYVVADGGMGGFSGGLYEGDFLPIPYPPWGGFGLHYDSRYADVRDGVQDGLELRVTGRHEFHTLELGTRVHRGPWRFFGELDYRPGDRLELSATAGFGRAWGGGADSEGDP